MPRPELSIELMRGEDGRVNLSADSLLGRREGRDRVCQREVSDDANVHVAVGLQVAGGG